MESIFHSELVRTLGWTFVHSLWQGLIAVTLLLLIFKVFRVQKAAQKYWLATTVLLVFVLTNILTFIILNNQQAGSLSDATFLGESAPTAFAGEFSIPGGMSSAAETDYLPYLMMGWLVGSIFFMIRFLYGIWYVKNLKATALQNVSGQWLQLLEALKVKMGIAKVIAFMESPNVSTPVVIGHLKPVILFPLGMISGLSQAQVEAILVHELSHIKRHDYLINIAQSFVEVVFYFNPFVWFISHTIRVEREHTCDDQTLSLGIAPHLYAHTLADVYEYQLATPRMSMAFATKEKFTLKRIQRLMKTQMNNNYNNKSLVGVLLASAVLILVYIGQIYPGSSTAEQSNIALLPTELFALDDVQEDFARHVTEAEFTIAEVPVSTKNIAEVVIAPDTIDAEEFKQRKKEFDEAIDDLHSSKEWQKMEELSKEMAKMNIEVISPMIDEHMLEALEEVRISEELVQEMVEMAHEIADATIQEEILEQVRETMLMHEEELQVQMEEINQTLREIDFEGIQEQAELARVIVEEAQMNVEEMQVFAKEAEAMAEKAKLYAEGVEEFHSMLVDMLIDDGYIKSKEDIDQLEFEDGAIYLNGDKLNKKDQKKYMDLHNKYFDEGEFRVNGHE